MAGSPHERKRDSDKQRQLEPIQWGGLSTEKNKVTHPQLGRRHDRKSVQGYLHAKRPELVQLPELLRYALEKRGKPATERGELR